MCLDRKERNELVWKIAVLVAAVAKHLPTLCLIGATVAFDFDSVHSMNDLICTEQG